MQTKSTKNSNEANAVNNAPKQAAAPAPKKEEKQKLFLDNKFSKVKNLKQENLRQAF